MTAGAGVVRRTLNRSALTERCGVECQPVVVVDNFMPDPQSLIATAESLEFRNL